MLLNTIFNTIYVLSAKVPKRNGDSYKHGGKAGSANQPARHRSGWLCNCTYIMFACLKLYHVRRGDNTSILVIMLSFHHRRQPLIQT